MEEEAAGSKRVLGAIKVFRQRLPESLAYLDYLYQCIDARVEEAKVEPAALRMLYRLDAFPEGSEEYRFMSKRIDRMLGDRREELKRSLDELISLIVRCSSIIENLNSRLRTAFNDMRGVNEDFLELLQCYYNTREYLCSNVPERVGKSPLELYNGDGRRFFDIIMPKQGAV